MGDAGTSGKATFTLFEPCLFSFLILIFLLLFILFFLLILEKTDPEGTSPTPVVYVKITEAQIREIEESKEQCEESRKTRGTAHPITLEQLVKLGDLYYSTYQWLEAEACFRQAWGGFR